MKTKYKHYVIWDLTYLNKLTNILTLIEIIFSVKNKEVDVSFELIKCC